MHVEVRWVEIPDSSVAMPSATEYMLERPTLRHSHGVPLPAESEGRTGTFWVPHRPLVEEQLGWSVTRKGQYVRIPLIPYRTQGTGLAWIWGLGLEMGMRGMQALTEHADRKLEIERIVLVLGHDCPRVEEGYRCFVGIAFQLKE